MGAEELPRVVYSQHKRGWLAFTRCGRVLTDDGERFIYFRTEQEAWQALADSDKVRELQFPHCKEGLVAPGATL